MTVATGAGGGKNDPMGWRSLTLVAVGGLLFGCGGEERDAGGLRPEHYVIAEHDRPAPGKHLRFKEPDRNGGGLDVAVTSYVSTEPGRAPVLLIGVVHIADKIYYEAVQREIDACSIVLYEGVKDSAASTAEWHAELSEGEGAASMLQKRMAKWFGFEFQLDALDYTKPSFVHADMSTEEFVERGGEEFVGELSGDFDSEVASLPSGVGDTVRAIIAFGEAALSGPVMRSMARRMLAESMGTMDIGTTLDMVPGMSELLIDKRNAVVIGTLKKHYEKEKGVIGILYGAAHMDDLERTLTQELGYVRERGHWLRAWGLRPPLRRR